MTDDTASPMPGAEAKSGRRRRPFRVVAAILGSLVVLAVLLHIPGMLIRRRARAAARHFEALGGRCRWDSVTPPWPFKSLGPPLDQRYAVLLEVDLSDTNAADADLAHLKGLRGLRTLRLNGTQITDAGLEHFYALTQLVVLHINDTRITDAGLARLRLRRLQWLYLGDTQVTEAGVAELKAALPWLKVIR